MFDGYSSRKIDRNKQGGDKFVYPERGIFLFRILQMIFSVVFYNEIRRSDEFTFGQGFGGVTAAMTKVNAERRYLR